jgi:membrane-associated PAP2 superfamily phosphatase
MSYRTRFWWAHTRWALLLFILLAVPLADTQWDLVIARHFYFDAAAGQWLGAHNFWINGVIHNGGRWTIRVIVLLLGLAWTVTLCTPRLAEWRRPAAYAFLCMVSCSALAGLLKLLTNVHCPWDLREFGGHAPFVPLFAARTAGLLSAHCFPSAHASSGYALVAFYFGLRERYPALAKWCAAVALLTGLTFGVAQQARGAHFFSHDVWGAFLTWTLAASLYAFVFAARVWPDSPPRQEEAAQQFTARLGQHAT